VKRKQTDPTDNTSDAPYRGRFAPSPTGPLHFGSIVTATASYLQAITAGGEWLLRIENIDPPRESPAASDQIIATLHAHGFEWTGPVLYQSDSRFDSALKGLVDLGWTYRCACSRKQVQAQAHMRGPLGPIYPGTCRDARLKPKGAENLVTRVRVGETKISFADRLYGRIDGTLETQVGDFIIRRADGLFAYALAVVVDDGNQGITEIVRGADLLDFTPAQIHLQRLLGLETPAYFHIPVAVNTFGDKLSKQTGAEPVDDNKPAFNLVRCLKFLRQDPPESLTMAPPQEIWAWARENWHPDRLEPMAKMREK
jgi:glutamyl-Q tRNA(Asp) synthetase